MTMHAAFGEPTGQGWPQIGELAVAFALSALIGLEREAKQKAAGVRTYTLVGTAAALFMLISKYGFTDVLSSHVVLDPSRVAAQVVSGVGFIGGGIIFVYRDNVRGLTTAASVWLTAAIGAAAGAGLPVLATGGTCGYFIAILALPPLGRVVTRRFGGAPAVLRISYHDGRGLLRQILTTITDCGFQVSGIETGVRSAAPDPDVEMANDVPQVGVAIQLVGTGNTSDLISRLAAVEGVVTVEADEGELAY